MRKYVPLILVLLAVAPLTWAAEGRIPIFEAITLDNNLGPIGGKYVVTNNITVTTGSVIRIIGVGDDDDVEIDLNGFTLTVGVNGDEVVHATGLRNLVIRNGVIRQLGTIKDCVRVIDTSQANVEDLRINGGHYGVYLGTLVKSFAIRGNTIEDTQDNAILVNYTTDQNAVEVAEGAIEDNTIRDVGRAVSAPSGGRGIEVRFGVSSVEIKNNRIERPHTYGMTVNSQGAVVISGNRVNQTGYRGIIASRTGACRVSNNVVKGSGVLQDANANRGGDGIFVNETASDCLLLNNVSNNNWMSGIRVEGLRNHLDRNVVNFNRLAGLHFEESADLNTFGRNTARGNANAQDPVGTCTANPACSGLSEPEFCDEGTNNTSFGDNLAPGPPPC